MEASFSLVTVGSYSKPHNYVTKNRNICLTFGPDIMPTYCRPHLCANYRTNAGCTYHFLFFSKNQRWKLHRTPTINITYNDVCLCREKKNFCCCCCDKKLFVLLQVACWERQMFVLLQRKDFPLWDNTLLVCLAFLCTKLRGFFQSVGPGIAAV